jgi:hypothetical protein
MLVALTKGFRFRIAIAMAAAAVFAFVAPPIAVAFDPTEHAIYCLTHTDHAIGPAYVDHTADHKHASGGHDHAKHSHQSDKHPSHCCGLFCVTALAPEIRQEWNAPILGPEPSSAIEPSFHSRSPELPYRPPISPLSA